MQRGRGRGRKYVATTLGKAPPVPSCSDDNETSLDKSELMQPIRTSVSGLKQVLCLYETATEEVKYYLSFECDVIYECKKCRSLHRSIANFILHKREFCKGKYSPPPDITESIIHSPDVSTVPNKTIASVISKMVARQNCEELCAAAASCKDEPKPNRFKANAVALETIDHNKSAMFQTVLTSSGEDEEDDDEEKDLRVLDRELMKSEISEIHKVLNNNIAVLTPDGKVTDRPNSLHLVCKFCDVRFATKKTLTHHVKYKHNDTRVVYLCPESGCTADVFSNTWSVFRHLYKVHRKTHSQVKKMRGLIQTSVMVRGELAKKIPPRSNKNALKKLVIDDKRWSDNYDGDCTSQVCGGCGKRFERRAALNAHSQTCQANKRSFHEEAADEEKGRKILTDKPQEKSRTAVAEKPKVLTGSRKGKAKIVIQKRPVSENDIDETMVQMMIQQDVTFSGMFGNSRMNDVKKENIENQSETQVPKKRSRKYESLDSSKSQVESNEDTDNVKQAESTCTKDEYSNEINEVPQNVVVKIEDEKVAEQNVDEIVDGTIPNKPCKTEEESTRLKNSEEREQSIRILIQTVNKGRENAFSTINSESDSTKTFNDITSCEDKSEDVTENALIEDSNQITKTNEASPVKTENIDESDRQSFVEDAVNESSALNPALTDIKHELGKCSSPRKLHVNKTGTKVYLPSKQTKVCNAAQNDDENQLIEEGGKLDISLHEEEVVEEVETKEVKEMQTNEVLPVKEMQTNAFLAAKSFQPWSPGEIQGITNENNDVSPVVVDKESGDQIRTKELHESSPLVETNKSQDGTTHKSKLLELLGGKTTPENRIERVEAQMMKPEVLPRKYIRLIKPPGANAQQLLSPRRKQSMKLEMISRNSAQEVSFKSEPLQDASTKRKVSPIKQFPSLIEKLQNRLLEDGTRMRQKNAKESKTKEGSSKQISIKLKELHKINNELNLKNGAVQMSCNDKKSRDKHGVKHKDKFVAIEEVNNHGSKHLKRGKESVQNSSLQQPAYDIVAPLKIQRSELRNKLDISPSSSNVILIDPDELTAVEEVCVTETVLINKDEVVCLSDDTEDDDDIVTLELKAAPYMDQNARKCVPCNRVHDTFDALLKHMATHFKWFHFQCNDCLFKAYDHGTLQAHLVKQHRIPARELERYTVRLAHHEIVKNSVEFQTLLFEEGGTRSKSSMAADPSVQRMIMEVIFGSSGARQQTGKRGGS